MYCLEVIHSINAKAAVKSAVANREASYCASKRGIVLHSAIYRDTVFIHAGYRANAFLRIAKKHEQAKNKTALNNLIERIYAKNCT
jgi:hypothetical protein